LWTSGYGVAFLLFAVVLAALVKGIRPPSSWKSWPVLVMSLLDAIAIVGALWLQTHGLDQATSLDLETSTPSSLSVVAMARIASSAMVATTVFAAVATARSREDALRLE
jgi:biotin transporter BioY